MDRVIPPPELAAVLYERHQKALQRLKEWRDSHKEERAAYQREYRKTYHAPYKPVDRTAIEIRKGRYNRTPTRATIDRLGLVKNPEGRWVFPDMLPGQDSINN